MPLILARFAKQPLELVFKPLLAASPRRAPETLENAPVVGVVEALCPIPARGFTLVWRAIIVWKALPGLFA